MAAPLPEPQQQGPQAHGTISQGKLTDAPTSFNFLSCEAYLLIYTTASEPFANSTVPCAPGGVVAGNPSSLALDASHTTATKPKAKRQPWQLIWPAPREPASQANIFGFQKGEVMVFDGNAGNFFARDAWTIEQEGDNSAKTADGAKA